MSLRGRIFTVVIALNVLLTTAFTLWGYRTEKTLAMTEVDYDLLDGALALRQHLSANDLGGSFHDNALAGREQLKGRALQDTMVPLYELASCKGLAFLYTLVEQDGELCKGGEYCFVIDSPTAEEAEQWKSGNRKFHADQPDNLFLHPWTEDHPPPAVLRDLFDDKAREDNLAFAEYEDPPYGDFRSIFVTSKTPAGRTIVLGADIPLTSVDEIFLRKLWPPLLGGLAILVLSLISAALAIRRVVRPLRRLADSTALIAEGNLDAEIPQSPSHDEIGALSRSFENMRVSLKEHIANLAQTTAAKERIEGELKIARTIQMSLLPKRLPADLTRSELALEGYLEPAKEVGGDLYDYFFTDKDHLFFTVGDVSDKGVPAALFMAVTKTLIKSMASFGTSPSEVLARVNRELCQENSETMFVTVFCGVLDLRTGELRYSNGGHNPPLLIRTNGATDWLPVPEGLVLGIDPDTKYETRAVRLAAGETLLVYSDGVTESMNPDRKLYSDAHLKEIAGTCEGREPAATVEIVVHSVADFVSGATQSDDITILAVRYNGKGSAPPASRLDPGKTLS
ncbi:MAG: PP2C family protein-serine/threonine phosphatase [Proteobacteria bacterium]|jgi:serine phosphatase RsbU (regulator of sigma subunit)|nr:PP2C family protein-serine/threonine phosphatase [Pseudomonadota bacterium]